jgi:hypothetical protein
MAMLTYSAYRAWMLEGGIGESPGAAVGQGNQYLNADSDLWYAAGVPAEMQPWLMLSSSAPDQLGWAVAPLKSNWYFVAYLQGTGRANYYAHARGWPNDQWQDLEFDPGAWLGDISAFDPMWHNKDEWRPATPKAPVERAAVWKDLALRRPQTAAQVLAHLYQAVDARSNFVWHVSAEEFRAGSDVPELVAMARAALPANLKTRARIRINTDDSVRLLTEFRAHLIVLGENFEPPHQAAVVLDSEGVIRKGEPPSQKAVVFARAVVDRLKAESRSVLRFSAIASERLAKVTEPKVLGVAVPIVYHIAVALSRKGQLDELLPQLMRASQRREALVMNWSELIPNAEWANVKAATLKELALEEAPTEDSEALRSEARDRLLRRGDKLNDSLDGWWLPDIDHARTLLSLLQLDRDLVGERLISRSAASKCLCTLPPPAAAQLLMDPVYGGTFAYGVITVPESWLTPELLKPSDPVRAFLAVARKHDSIAPWRTWLDSWVELIAWTNCPADPAFSLALCSVGPPDETSGTMLTTAYGELFTRCSEAQMAKLMGQRLLKVEQDQEQQILVRFCIENESLFLNSHLSTVWLLKYGLDGLPEGVVRLLDQRAQGKRRVGETSLIQESGRWLEWRMKSGIDAQGSIECAIAWLLCKPRNPSKDEWKRVVRDLASITGQQMRDIVNRLGNVMPWIEGARDEQVLDLLAISVDLAADGAIASLGPQPVGTSFVEEHSPRMVCLPKGTLDWLRSENAPAPACTFTQAGLLLDRSGSQRDRVLSVYVAAYVAALTAGDTAAPADAVQRGLWKDPAFRRKIAEWLKAKRDALVKDGSGQALNEAIDLTEAPGAKYEDMIQVAEFLQRMELFRLARFLAPDMIGVSYARNAARLLCQGRTSGDDWQELLRRSKESLSAWSHPLVELASAIDQLEPSQQEQLERNGWAPFLALLDSCHQLQQVPETFGGALPSFMVLAKIASRRSLGEIACILVLKQRALRAGNSLHPIWLQALVRAVVSAKRRPGACFCDDREAALARLFRTVYLVIANGDPAARKALGIFFEQVAPKELWIRHQSAETARQVIP